MSMKQKSGLHKEISSIFSGVPLPSSNADRNTVKNGETTDKTAGHIPPMTSASPKLQQISSQEPNKATQEPTKATEKPKESAVPAPEPAHVPASSKGPKKFVRKKQLSSVRKSLDQLVQQIKVKLLTPPEGVSPAKHMTTLVAIPILFLVAIVVLGRMVLKSGVKGGKDRGDDMSMILIAPKTEPEWQRPSVYPVGLRDPMKKASAQGFATSGTTDVEMANVAVNGIVWSDDKAAAIIGTEIIYEGQTVQGVTIIKIEKDSVEFEKDDKRWTQKVAN